MRRVLSSTLPADRCGSLKVISSRVWPSPATRLSSRGVPRRTYRSPLHRSRRVRAKRRQAVRGSVSRPRWTARRARPASRCSSPRTTGSSRRRFMSVRRMTPSPKDGGPPSSSTMSSRAQAPRTAVLTTDSPCSAWWSMSSTMMPPMSLSFRPAGRSWSPRIPMPTRACRRTPTRSC